MIQIKKKKKKRPVGNGNWLHCKSLASQKSVLYFCVSWLCGGRQGWDVLREQHWNMYIVKGETDHQPRLDAWDKCSDLVHWKTQKDGVEREVGGGGRDGDYM